MILSYDIASRLTGFCAGTGDDIPVAGALAFPQVGDDLGKLLDMWDRYLVAHFNRFSPTAVIYEMPILVVGDGSEGSHTDKPLTLRKLYSLGAYLEFFCLRRRVECSEVTLQDIKKEVTGNPLAKKEQIATIAERVGIILPEKDAHGRLDASDAWGAWLIGVRHYNRRASERWDRAVRSPRGKFV